MFQGHAGTKFGRGVHTLLAESLPQPQAAHKRRKKQQNPDYGRNSAHYQHPGRGYVLGGFGQRVIVGRGQIYHGLEGGVDELEAQHQCDKLKYGNWVNPQPPGQAQGQTADVHLEAKVALAFPGKKNASPGISKRSSQALSGRGSVPGLGGGVRVGIDLKLEDAGLHLPKPHPLGLIMVVVAQQVPQGVSGQNFDLEL